MQYFQRGFTLIELLIGIAIISILMLIALPSQHAPLTEKKFDRTINQMLEALRIARQEAMARGMIVTLCPDSDAQVCGEDWSQGVIIFADEMAHGNIQDPTHIIVRLPFAITETRVFLSAFPSDTNYYFQFASNGFTRNQNGSFYFCPQNANLFPQRIVINQAGRSYRTEEETQQKCAPY